MAGKQQHDECPFKDIVFPELKNGAPATEYDHKMDTRVGRLEGVVESLTQNIQEVSQNINVMGRELGSFKEVVSDTLSRTREGFTSQLEAVTNRMTASAKPQWQTITAFVALAITVLGMAGAVVGLMLSGQSERITRLQNDTATITDRMFLNQYEKGKSDAFAAETSSHLTKLDTTLQREMALIKQTTDSEIRGLDDKLQTELRLDRANNADYHDKIAEILKELRNWRLEHVETGAAIDARLTAKQEMVLDLIKGLDERVTRDEARRRDEIQRYESFIKDLQPKK
jgi:hypothetical protein